MKKIFNKYPNTTVILFITLLILFYVGKRSYNTKILPFQSITINCIMDGKQRFPKNGGVKYAPIVRFPKVFKIKFGFWDGEFLEGGEVLIKNDFLEQKTFGYQYYSSSLNIEPTYMPDWIKDGEPPGNSMNLTFPNVFGKREILFIDYFYPGDYDAIYDCKEL
jgi:hypothetical protein|tara:strand:+ start:65 stop:553 length:489 start_codon:yes stop_codon:yes gene_type:complete